MAPRQPHHPPRSPKPSHPPESGPTDIHSLFAASLLAFILLIGVIGNFLVIYMFGWLRKGRRTSTEFIFLLLGITDFLCCLLAVPVQFYDILTNERDSEFSNFIRSSYLPTLLPLAFLLSQGLLVLICVDRYQAVAKPFARRLGEKWILCIYFTLSLLGLSIYLPFFTIRGGNRQRTRRNDTGKTPQSFVHDAEKFLAHGSIDMARDVVGLLIMIVLVHKTLKVLAKRKENLQITNSTLYDKQNKAVRKTLIIIIIVFTILIFPFDIVFFVTGFQVVIFGPLAKSHETGIKKLLIYLRSMQISNSCANFFIYSFVHPAFGIWRRRIRAALRGLYCYRRYATNKVRPVANSGVKIT